MLSHHNKTMSDRHVSIAKFAVPEEARIAQGLLQSTGIACYLSNDHTVAPNRLSTSVLAGLELLVPEHVADQARSLLKARVSDQELNAQAQARRESDEV